MVGLYAVAQVGMSIDGGAWVWALPICLLGQALVVCVYAELASQWPLAGGAYQWTRRLARPSFAWLSGWLWQFAVMFANTTVAYLASPGSSHSSAPPPPRPNWYWSQPRSRCSARW